MIHAIRHFLALQEIAEDDILSLLVQSEEYFLSDGVEPQAHPLTDRYIVLVCWPIDPDSKRQKLGANLLTSSDVYTLRSFFAAAVRLGATCLEINPDPAESLSDVIRSVTVVTEQSGDGSLAALVVRHRKEGVPHQVTRLAPVRDAGIAIINGGDGRHENPAEALLYMSLVWQRYRKFAGLKVLIVGDLQFDPLSRSLIFGLSKLGAEIHLLGPLGLVPQAFSDTLVTVHISPTTLNQEFDVVLSIPVSSTVFEEGILPSQREYLTLFSLSNLPPNAIGQGTLVLPCRTTVDGQSVDPCSGLNEEFSSLIVKPTDALAVATKMATYKFCLLQESFSFGGN